MKGYNTSNGYMGYVEGKCILFASEQEYLDVAIKVVMVMKDMVCKVCDSGISGGEQKEQNCTCKDPDDQQGRRMCLRGKVKK